MVAQRGSSFFLLFLAVTIVQKSLQVEAADINFDTGGKPSISIRDPLTNARDDFIGPFLGTIRATVDLPPGVDSIRLPLIFWAIDSW